MEKENKTYTISDEIMYNIIKYVKDTKFEYEHEWGDCRSVQEVIESGDMPDFYYELIKLIND